MDAVLRTVIFEVPFLYHNSIELGSVGEDGSDGASIVWVGYCILDILDRLRTNYQ